MTPEKVLEKLENMGVKTSRSTLLRFEKAGLIPAPTRGAYGRGQGRYTDYPENTPEHFFASWRLLKDEKLSMDVLAQMLKDGEKILGQELQELDVLNQDLKEIQDNVLSSQDEEMEKKLDEIFKGDIRAFKALFSYLTEIYDYDPEDLYRAKELVDNWLGFNNKTTNSYNEKDIMLSNFISSDKKQTIQAAKLYHKWRNYCSDAEKSMLNIIKKVETYEKTISYLENENKRLREELEKLKNRPN